MGRESENLNDNKPNSAGAPQKGLCLDLFKTFARIGGLTFGGGYAMLPMLQREVVEKRGWATEEEMLDYFAIGQCTPGIIAVNTATFVGYRTRGIAGAVAATAGVVFPSLIIIMVIAAALSELMKLPDVGYIFNGIRVAVCVLILNAIIKLWKSSVKDKTGIVIFAVAVLLGMFTGVSPIFITLGAALACIIIKSLEGKRA